MAGAPAAAATAAAAAVEAAPVPNLDLTALRQQGAQIQLMQITKGTRKQYESNSVKMLQWMFKYQRDVLTDEFLAGVENQDEGPSKEYALQWVTAPIADVSKPPIKFDVFSYETHFAPYLVWLLPLSPTTVHADGDADSIGHSALSMHRSALKNLYRDYHVTMNEKMVSEIAQHFTGVKRSIAQRQKYGDEPVQVGKDPMDFSFYKWMCMALLKAKGTKKAICDYVVGHLMLILSWNLMSRVSNSVNICLAHLTWTEDCLGVVFPMHKGDQDGKHGKEARSIYANPLEPEVCCITSLGLYFLSYPQVLLGKRLFPGDSQEDRYSKTLQRVLRSEEGAEECAARGIDPDVIGTRSARKGSATFSSCGTTACPNDSLVNLRAGWSQGGVESRYKRFNTGGDRFIGRIIAGLPSMQAEFAILPPFFLPEARDLVRHAINICFPGILASLMRIAEFALASVVWHHAFLRSTLPAHHPALLSRLFSEQGLLSQLHAYVVCRLWKVGDPFTATGIPPFVEGYVSRHKIEEAIIKLTEVTIEVGEKTCASTRDAIQDLLADHAAASGALTVAQMEASMQKSMDRTIAENATLKEMLSEVRTMRQAVFSVQPLLASPAPVATLPSSDTATKLITWPSGGLHRVREDFELPKGDPFTAWQWHCLGNASQSIPPLRHLESSDLSTPNKKRRLTDFRFLMQKLESRASELPQWKPYVQDGRWVKQPSSEEATQMFQETKDAIALPVSTASGRKRKRAPQMNWRSYVNELRKKDQAATKAATHTAAEEDEEEDEEEDDA